MAAHAPRRLELPPAGVPVPCALPRVTAEQLAAQLSGCGRRTLCGSLRAPGATDTRAHAAALTSQRLALAARTPARSSWLTRVTRRALRVLRHAALQAHRRCCPSASSAQDFAGGHVARARQVPTQSVFLQDEGPGGGVDKA